MTTAIGNANARAVVIGANGQLGSRIVASLAAAGDEVLGIDIVAPDEPPAPVEVIDLLDTPALTAVLREDDIIVHTASAHLSGKDQSTRGYRDVNGKGTWSVYEAARLAGVDAVVLTSTLGALGHTPARAGIVLPGDFVRLSSDAMFPTRVEWPNLRQTVSAYMASKRLQEDIAELFAATDGIRTAILRPTGFDDFDKLTQGKHFLTGYGICVREDITSAHVAAVNAIRGGRVLNGEIPIAERFPLTSSFPFTEEDYALVTFEEGMRPLLEKYWPGVADWFAARGVDFPASMVPALLDMSDTHERLGWRPSYEFEDWFAEYRDVL